jgi:hypothetical protein
MSTEAEQDAAFVEWLKNGTGDFHSAVPVLNLPERPRE